MESYRTRIYKQYAATFQDAKAEFDQQVADCLCRVIKYSFRGWWPQQQDATIIDLACGGGKLLYCFKKQGFDNIAGVDISPDQVALSRQVTDDVTQANILDYLQEHKNSFDLITGIDIIEHFHKDEVLNFLDLCQAALKPDGRLILQTPNADSPWGATLRYGDFTHEVCFNPNSLARLMKLSGFIKIESRETGPVPFGYSFKSTVRYLLWQSIRGLLMLWNIAETGSKGSGVFTRVFLISGTK